MRDKVSGIGKKIEILMEKNNISIEELHEKTNISTNILKDIISLKKEPFAIIEMILILQALGLEKRESIEFIDNWLKLARERQNAKI